MAPSSRRRGHGEDSIYFDASKNRWIGATSLGWSPDGAHRLRQKVRGKTKAEVRDKLQALHRELDVGVRTSATYTVAACVQDWLAQGLADKQASTVENYTRLASHVISALGAVKLKNLTARQVQAALGELSPSLSTRSLRLVHQRVAAPRVAWCSSASAASRWTLASAIHLPISPGSQPASSAAR
jgi:hypothetical protein